MTTRKIKFQGLLLIPALLMLCGCALRPGIPVESTPETVQLAPSEVIENKITDLLEQMTLEEKIGQMTQVERQCIRKGDIRKHFIGSIFSGGGSAPSPNEPQSWADMTTEFQDEALATRLGIPILYGIDSVHGNGALYGATIFPHEIGLGATRDTDLVYQIGQVTASEMIAIGTRWNFSPVVAVPQDIRWGRTYEAYSEDTALTAELGAAYIKGLQSLPASYPKAQTQSIFVLATPKHYLGDGGTTFGSSTVRYGYASPDQVYQLDQGDMRLPEAALRELFLPPYQSAVDAGAISVMASFSSWNGTKMHAQRYLLMDVLKGELGFDGFIVSDYAGIDQVASDYYTSVVTSINAGIDMSMVPCDYVTFIETVQTAVEKGDIPVKRIDDAVRRILRAKLEMGVFEHPYADEALIPAIGSIEHRNLARKAVSESLVLLKNENNSLPIKRDAETIFVSGVAADDIGIQCGGWTITWQGETGAIQPGTTILEGIQAAVSPDTHVVYSEPGVFEGFADYGIVVVGEIPYAEGYGDKEDLSLSGYDIDIILKMREHAEKLIVILLSGRPMMITSQYPVADAWVAAWLPGTEGEGVSDVLFGSLPFTGKLSYTWPRFNGQLPINKNNSSGSKPCETPLFPYGYGLGEAGSKPIKWVDCPEFED
ncbi:MAG: glycoside hydrolase family 3 protein [Anaerolineaceae bacterium]